MSVDVAFPIFASALFGVVVWFASLALVRTSTVHAERAAWFRLVFPLFVGALVVSFLAGWAFEQANPVDEQVCLVLRFLSFLVACIGLRTLGRALAALGTDRPADVPVCTVGLFRPRVVVSDEFRRVASEPIIAAALAHEAAHVKWRDPLRIWLGQVGADLQWPIPGSARRFSAWLLALEAERDREAVATGVSPEDLAEAILVAAHLQRDRTASPGANAAGAGDGLTWRIRRLLSQEDVGRMAARSMGLWRVRASCIALMTAATWLGARYGDAILDAVPGIAP